MYLDEFWYLRTEAYWATGPIPAHRVREVAFRLGLPADMIGLYMRTMRRMDDAYLGWINEEMERERKQREKRRPGRKFFQRRRR